MGKGIFTYRKYKREGRCPTCGNAHTDKSVLCPNCKKKHADRNNQRIKDGLCTSCTKPAALNKTKCQSCLNSNRVRGKGLSSEARQKAFDAIAAFDGKCQACGSTSANSHTGEFHIDHKGDKFRGILCYNCNVALGLLHDSEHHIEQLLAYLRLR